MLPEIYRVRELPQDCLKDMLLESQQNGFNAIQRLIDEWIAGTNRFDRPGEALFVAKPDAQIIGICGLTLDPYTASISVGRVRRLYVLQAHRRQGIGRTLVQRVIAEARLYFDWLHVRTDAPIADQFYQSLGFMPHLGNEHCTHKLDLRPDRRSRQPSIQLFGQAMSLKKGMRG